MNLLHYTAAQLSVMLACEPPKSRLRQIIADELVSREEHLFRTSPHGPSAAPKLRERARQAYLQLAYR